MPRSLAITNAIEYLRGAAAMLDQNHNYIGDLEMAITRSAIAIELMKKEIALKTEEEHRLTRGALGEDLTEIPGDDSASDRHL